MSVLVTGRIGYIGSHPCLQLYDNNVYGTLALVAAARLEAGVINLIFSSSATVYGVQPVALFDESLLTGYPANPYGRSKLMVEQIRICSMPIPAGSSACCAISIRLAPIPFGRDGRRSAGDAEQSDTLYCLGRGGTSPLTGDLRQ